MLELSMNTPLGELRVSPSQDPAYPGFFILLNGEIISSTEYSPDLAVLRVLCYNVGVDEPAIVHQVEGT